MTPTKYRFNSRPLWWYAALIGPAVLAGLTLGIWLA